MRDGGWAKIRQHSGPEFVSRATAAIHADLHASILQHLGERHAGELTALIGVEDLGLAMPGQRLLQRLDAKSDVHRVGQTPRQHAAAVPIHDRHQIQKATTHRNICDVGTPDLVGPNHRQIPQKIWINPMLRVRCAGIGLLENGPKPHLAHQPGHAMATNAMAQTMQMPHHLPRTVIWRFQKGLVDQPHQRKRILTLACRPIIVPRPADLKQRALLNDRQPLVFRVDLLAPPFDAHRPEAFAKKSRSTTNWPILACSRDNSASLLA